jgi:hypothetical protein
MDLLTRNCVAHNVEGQSRLGGGINVTAKAKVKYRVGKDVDLKKTTILDKNGKRLTNARAEKIAQEVVERVVGRPSLSGLSKESPLVRARVPETLKAKLVKEAKRRGETPSELIREALESYLSA